MSTRGVREGCAPWPFPAVLAHRCGGALAPENTLEGLEVAQRCGAGAEFDVMLSAEGTPWLIHDETLERTTSGYGEVAHTPDYVLSALDAGSWYERRFAGARLPRLDEAARACLARGVWANIEIKPSAGQEVRTAETVAAHVAALWASSALPLLSSFSEVALRTAARVAPHLPRGLLVEDVPDDWKARCERLDAVALHAHARKLSKAQVRSLHAGGVWVVAYTENDPARARILFDWGVDCVITDRPDLVFAKHARRADEG